MRRLLLLLVLVATCSAESFWAVVTTTDHAGASATALIELSASSPSSAPEIKALKEQADAGYLAAKAAWEDRRKAWEADAANRGKSFRKAEAEPAKPTVKVDGQAFRTKADAEALLAKRQQEDLAKRNPGLAWRKQVLNQRLLQHFTIGVEAPAEWHIEVREKHGARFATNMQYLSHVVEEGGDNGDKSWFFKYGGAESQIKQAQQADIIAWFTWYGLAEAPPARYKPNPPAATAQNAKVKDTMWSYWTIYKRFLQLCAKYPDVPVVLQVEPDEWGHLLLATGAMDPHKAGTVLVGGSGVEELKGMPDTVAGWAKAFRHLRDLYAPRVLLCANPSAWDRNGAMSGANWAKYFKECDVTPEGWDLFVAQLNDWDRGLHSNGSNAKWPPYTEKDLVIYHGGWDAMAAWIKEIHDGTGLWCSLWQLPIGNTTYATCDGSEGHGTDGIVEALLDNYPQNDLAARFAKSGCCMWIFSRGGGGALAWDARKDGITNPKPISGNKGKVSEYPDDDGGYMRLKGAEYFKNPVPILGKPVARKAARGKAEPAEAKETGAAADRPVAAPAAAKPALKLVKPEAAASWSAKLRDRVRMELAANRHPVFRSQVLREVSIEALDGNGVLNVKIAGGGTMDLPWSQLRTADLASLAQALVRSGEPESSAAAAFFLLLEGQPAKAEEHLARAGGVADAVREAFAPAQ